ncbi:MAG: hypothetical protein AAB956_00480 [Patescibacteria group bacterium]
MFLTIHSTLGVVIGQYAPNPIWAFFVGLFSHYIFDIIPHGDEVKLGKLSLAGMAWAAIIDQAILLLNFMLLAYFKTADIFTPLVIAAVIGAILPDWLMAVHRLCEEWNNRFARALRRLLDPLQNFHYYLHVNFLPYEIPFSLGLAIQIIFLAGMWTII